MLKAYLVENSLIKNLAALLAGSSTIQVLSLLSVPLLAHFYSPSDFGELSLLNSMTAIASVIVLLSLDNAYLSETSEDELRRIIQFGSLIIIMVIILVPLFIFIPIPKFISSKGLTRSILVLIPFSIIMTFLSRFNISIWNREKTYSRISQFEVIKKVAIISLQLLIALIISNQNGLVYGLLIGSLVPFLVYGFPVERPVNIRDLVPRTLQRQRVFIVDNTLQSALYRLLSEAPVFVITLYMDLSALGIYFMATRLVQLPGRLAGNSIHRLLMGEYRPADKGRSLMLHFRFTMIIFILAIIFYVFLLVVGESLVITFLGIEWKSAYDLSLIIFVWTGFTLTSIPSRTYYIADRSPKRLLHWDLIVGGARLSTLYLYRHSSLLELMKNYVIVSSVVITTFIISTCLYVRKAQKS